MTEPNEPAAQHIGLPEFAARPHPWGWNPSSWKHRVRIAVLAMAVDEVWSTCLYLWRVWRTTRDPYMLWRTFCGQPSAAAHDQAAPPHSQPAFSEAAA